MGWMSATRWKLPELLAERGISAYAFAQKAIGTHPNTLYRLAREGHAPTRLDFGTLTIVLDTLRSITDEELDVVDLIQYDPDSKDDLAPKKGPLTQQTQITKRLEAIKAEFKISDQELQLLVKEMA